MAMAHLTLTASFEYIRYIKRVCFVSVYKCQNGARLHDFFGPARCAGANLNRK